MRARNSDRRDARPLWTGRLREETVVSDRASTARSRRSTCDRRRNRSAPVSIGSLALRCSTALVKGERDARWPQHTHQLLADRAGLARRQFNGGGGASDRIRASPRRSGGADHAVAPLGPAGLVLAAAPRRLVARRAACPATAGGSRRPAGRHRRPRPTSRPRATPRSSPRPRPRSRVETSRRVRSSSSQVPPSSGPRPRPPRRSPCSTGPSSTRPA